MCGEISMDLPSRPSVHDESRQGGWEMEEEKISHQILPLLVDPGKWTTVDPHKSRFDGGGHHPQAQKDYPKLNQQVRSVVSENIEGQPWINGHTRDVSDKIVHGGQEASHVPPPEDHVHRIVPE